MKEKITLKSIGIKNLILLLVAGVCLVVFSLPNLFSRNTEIPKVQEQIAPVKDNTNADSEYEQEMELFHERLEQLLTRMKGVGAVSIMVTWKGSEEKIVLTEPMVSDPYVVRTVSPQVEGVVVVAQGGGDGKVASGIVAAIEALFSIPTHKIIVLPME